VSEGVAGATVLCECGQPLIVPSLRELRRQAGVENVPPTPEMVVETLIAAGRLPEGDECVECGTATTATLCCVAECERAYLKHSAPPAPIRGLLGVVIGAIPLVGPIILLILEGMSGGPREWGKDRIFPLPLRICEGCQQGLTSEAKIKAALVRIPVYKDLLDKYPGATVRLEG
jgi:hypothetical protein